MVPVFITERCQHRVMSLSGNMQLEYSMEFDYAKRWKRYVSVTIGFECVCNAMLRAIQHVFATRVHCTGNQQPVEAKLWEWAG